MFADRTRQINQRTGGIEENGFEHSDREQKFEGRTYASRCESSNTYEQLTLRNGLDPEQTY